MWGLETAPIFFVHLCERLHISLGSYWKRSVLLEVGMNRPSNGSYAQPWKLLEVVRYFPVMEVAGSLPVIGSYPVISCYVCYRGFPGFYMMT